MCLGPETKIKRVVHILCALYNSTEHSINVNYWCCWLNTKEDAENIWGDILEKYVVYGSHLPRRLKWSRCEALVTYCVQLS